MSIMIRGARRSRRATEMFGWTAALFIDLALAATHYDARTPVRTKESYIWPAANLSASTPQGD